MSKLMWAMVIGATFHATATSVAAAQDRERHAAPETHHAFDDDLVQGDAVGPDVEVLHTRRRGARDSLIRTREHFIDRLLTSVEHL